MKKIKNLLIFVFLVLTFLPINALALDKVNSVDDKVNVYLFHGKECPHCAAEIKYLNEVKDEYNLNIIYYEVWHNENNNEIMVNAKELFNLSGYSVPFTVIGDKTFSGYSSFMNSDFKRAFDAYQTDNENFLTVIAGGEVDKEIIEEEVVKGLPVLGDVDVKSVSLPLIAIIIGTIDGFNPCAMWVLLFLMSMLLGMKDKKRMWILGLAFLITSALFYFLVMMAWIKLTASFATIVWLRRLIAVVAIGGGLFNLRNYLKKDDDGCEVVDDKKRIRIIDRIKSFTNEKSFVLSLLGVITLAITVNFVELACSAGLPVLFAEILVVNDVTSFQYFMYTALYVLFFLIDDLIIFAIAMKTLKLTGISNKYGRYSHLIGGVIMVLIGILLIFKPEWIMLNF